MYTLIGQSFNPFDKKALPRTLTNSEYFKVLRRYRCEDLRDFFKVLEAQGYVTSVYKEIGGKQLPLIGVTEKGLAALESGDTRPCRRLASKRRKAVRLSQIFEPATPPSSGQTLSGFAISRCTSILP